jgi:hypothetical protein
MIIGAMSHGPDTIVGSGSNDYPDPSGSGNHVVDPNDPASG